MRKNFYRIILCFLLVVAGCLCLADSSSEIVYAAPVSNRGIPAGGKGSTEEIALEEMKKAALKKVLSQIVSWSDNPQSPYQQLLTRYKEFTGKETVKKKGNNNAGFYVLGQVPVKYELLQSELSKLVKAEQKKDEYGRRVYVLIRFLGSGDVTNVKLAEQAILGRYNTRLRESGFVVADADKLMALLSSYHGLNYDAYVNQVLKELDNDPSITVAIVGEISQTALEEDESGTTAACDINITAFDCTKNFNVITKYEGSDVLRRRTGHEAGKFLLEKAAITSSKAITDRLLVYWKQ